MLWDGSSPHRSGVVNDILEENKERITAFRLPPYYPKFNPVVFHWTHLKWSKMRGWSQRCVRPRISGRQERLPQAEADDPVQEEQVAS
ncbi:MAG: hypothetical protein JRN52_05995 [Nitrososphaerota archaeon]|nr:hypothetical protein [Nitrososphaerota archaeon]